MARPRKSEATRQTQQTLTEAAVYGAKLVRDALRGYSVVNGKRVKVSRVANSKLNAAKIAIEHSLGLPKAKIELKTDALTMKDIAELAKTFDELNTKQPESETIELLPKPSNNAKN